jgi:hypothetical protein
MNILCKIKILNKIGNNLYKKINNISYLTKKIGWINYKNVKIILIKIIKDHLIKIKIKILKL